MPTNRKRIRRPSQTEPWITAYYRGGYEGQGRRALLFGADDLLQAYPWTEAKKELLPEWIKENPCARPWMWWRTDAPEKRRWRVGGTGRCQKDPILDFGVPNDNWFKDVDSAQPPLYESEASYLLRHNLLTTAEKQHLAEHPELLESGAIKYHLKTGPEVYPVGYSGLGYYEESTNI
jgi:hypothetical protein